MESRWRLILVTAFTVAYLKFANGGFCQSHIHDRSPSYCEKKEINKTDKVLCSRKFDTSYFSVVKLKTLVFCNVAEHGFDPRLIAKFPHLYRLTLIFSNITHFTHPFPEHHHLQVLNLTRLDLHHLNLDIFEKLKFLKILDVSYNKLKSFGKHHFQYAPNLVQVHLRGNALDCNSELKWILGKRNGKSALYKKVVDLQQLVCSQSTFPGKPALVVMNYMKTLEAECPRHGKVACKCNLDNVVSSPGDLTLVPVTTVNCSGIGFVELPHQLPQNTTVLILNGNMISDVSPLLNNSWYQKVSDIYLDNNKISAVDQLERANWLSSFRVFSLRGNNLTTIPSYAFDYAFEKNSKIAKVYFGNNPWICDCSFTPGFQVKQTGPAQLIHVQLIHNLVWISCTLGGVTDPQELLRKFSPLVYDMKDIKCAPSYDDPNSGKVIKGLALVSICRDPEEFPLSSWDIVNIILMTLIVTIYSKLIYDYWVYKTTTKLPWIATKI